MFFLAKTLILNSDKGGKFKAMLVNVNSIISDRKVYFYLLFNEHHDKKNFLCFKL